MVRVVDCIDEIVEKCFGDQSLKEKLEFTVSSTKVTVKDQFLYHYETACYLGSKESLIRAILYRIHLQEDILLKLADYTTNLTRIFNLGEYSKVRLNYKHELGTETNIGVSVGDSKTDNVQADNHSGFDRNTNLGIANTRTGRAETNRVEKLDAVIPQAQIKEDLDNTTLQKYGVIEGRLTMTPVNYNQSNLDDPQYAEDDEKIGYQHLSKDLTTNTNRDHNYTESSRGSTAYTGNDSKNAKTNVRGNSSDVDDTVVEYVTNDARIKMWTKELPKLKTLFWNCFFDLFVYEQS